MNLTRRTLVVAAGLAAGLPGLTRAQTAPARVRRIGMVANSSATPPGQPSRYAMAFIGELQAQGFAYGIDYVIETRLAEGDSARLPALAAELVRLKVDVLVPIGSAAAHAAFAATRSIPIVCIGVHDPVGAGFAASLARPGGNVTGVAAFYGVLLPKQFEILKSIAPKITRVAILVIDSAVTREFELLHAEVQVAARRIGVQIRVYSGGVAHPFDQVFGALLKDKCDALIVTADSYFVMNRQVIADLALKHRLPTMFGNREHVVAGGLASYGENAVDLATRSARYVARIFKGAKAGELPIEQPTTFAMVVNGKTARTLGLSLSQEALLRAEEVIE